jgi:hypothetical protein
MAKASVQLLLKEIRRKRDKLDEPPAQQLLKHSLVRRDSTAPLGQAPATTSGQPAATTAQQPAA